MFNKSFLFNKKMNIIKMLNRFYKIYLRKTTNINLPKLCHNLNFIKNVVPVGLEPTSVVLEATAQPLYHGTKF